MAKLKCKRCSLFMCTVETCTAHLYNMVFGWIKLNYKNILVSLFPPKGEIKENFITEFRRKIMKKFFYENRPVTKMGFS